MRTVRVTAKTVEAAVEDGIKQLGISREEDDQYDGEHGQTSGSQAAEL